MACNCLRSLFVHLTACAPFLSVLFLAAALWNLGVRVKWLEDPVAVQTEANMSPEKPHEAPAKQNSSQGAAQSEAAAEGAAAAAVPATAATAAAK